MKVLLRDLLIGGKKIEDIEIEGSVTEVYETANIIMDMLDKVPEEEVVEA